MGWFDAARATVNVEPGKWYIFSCYANFYGVNGGLVVEELSNTGSFVRLLSYVTSDYVSGTAKNGIAGYSRKFAKFRAPASGLVSLCVRAEGGVTVNNPDVYVARPMFEECYESATEPSPWQNAGVTQVHGGSIIADTIRGNHIQANQTLRAPTIQGGQLNIGNGNFVVDSNGNLTARSGTFSGNLSGAKGTFSGDITGASGTFSGNVYAKNIKGDLVEPFIINAPNGVGEITVPAADYKRTLLVIPYSITASNYGNGKNNQLTYNVLMDNQVIATGTAFNGDNTIGTGSAILDAGRTVKLSMRKTGDGIFNPQIYILALRSS